MDMEHVLGVENNIQQTEENSVCVCVCVCARVCVRETDRQRQIEQGGVARMFRDIQGLPGYGS